MQIAELVASLGIKMDAASWARANTAIANLGRAMAGVYQRAQKWGQSLQGTLVKAAAGLGFGKLIETGLKYNATIEETRNQIAGMLALTKKTDLSDQLGVADGLMQSLQKRAAALPGTTQEYANMLGMLAQPITDAGLGLQDLEDITVSSTVGAKAWKLDWEASARDVAQAIRGQFHANDQFTGIVLGTIGYKGDEGREKFNALPAKKRAEEIKRGLTQKQFGQLAAAQGATASGKWSTFVDTATQTLGRVTAPLFAKLVDYLQKINKWLDSNSDKVQKWADKIGGVLVDAFDVVVKVVGVLGDVFDFLADHQSLVVLIGAIAAGFMLWESPLLAAVAVITGMVALLEKVGELASEVFGAINDGHMMEDAKRVLELQNQGLSESDAVAQVKSERSAANVSGGAPAGSIAARMLSPENDPWSSQYQGGGASAYAPWTPSVPGPAAGGAVTTNNQQVTIAPTINVTSSDPNGAANAIDEKLRQMTSDAHDTFRGGNR